MRSVALKSTISLVMWISLYMILVNQITPVHAEPLPTVDQVWMYAGFDGKPEPQWPAGKFQNVGFVGPGSAKPLFVAGKTGQALTIQKDGGFLEIRHGRDDFPTQRGSMLLWVCPGSDLVGSDVKWLVFGSWASFDLHIENQSILAYATGSSSQFLKGSLAPYLDHWKDQWHLIVMTWDDKQRRLFLDGNLLAKADDVAPFQASAIGSLVLGALPRFREKPPFLAIADGYLFDELTILNLPLSTAQITDLFTRGQKPDYAGLLAAFGGMVSLQMPRHGYVRGELVEGDLCISGIEAQSLQISAVPDSGGQPIALSTLKAQNAPLTFNTSDLRPGLYRIRVEAIKDGKVLITNEDQLLGIQAQRQPEFPIGLACIATYGTDMLRLMKQWHIDHTGAMGDVDANLFWQIDRLYTYGIGLAPCMNVHNHNALPLTDKDSYKDPQTGLANSKMAQEVLQGLVLAGDPDFVQFSTSLASPISPVAAEAMERRVRAFLQSSRNHPGLLSISFDDEYSLRSGINQKSGKTYYGDYSKSAREYFTKKTGLAPVYPPTELPGTILPDNHPYFAWMRTIGMPGDCSGAGLSMRWSELTRVVHEVRPDVQTTTYSGSEYGECDAVMDYGYPIIWQPHPGYNIGHGRLDVDFDSHRARQLVEPRKPIWALLGWWSSDLRGEKSNELAADFRLNTVMALAKGAESVQWFTAYDPTPNPGQFGGGVLSREDMCAEVQRWGNWLHRFGPMFRRLEVRPSHRVAVLLSEEDAAGKLHKGIHMSRPLWMYPALRVAGVPVDLVTDQQIKAGALDQYEALVLYGFQYASKSLWDKIDAFAHKPGKLVFCDSFTALKPQNAIDMNIGPAHGGVPPHLVEKFKDISCYGTKNMAWMAQQLRDSVAAKLRPAEVSISGSNLVAPFWLYSRNGTGRLLIIPNYHLSLTQNVDVTMNADVGTQVIELESGKVVGLSTASQSLLTWPAQIPAGDARMYLVIENGLGPLTITAHYESQSFRVHVKASDGAGQPLLAPLPVRLQWIAPDGVEVATYERFTAIDPATGQLELTNPRAMKMDKPGTWQIRVTALTGGQTATATVVIK